LLNIGFAVRSSGGGGGRDGRQWYEQCGWEGGIAVAKIPPMRSEVTVSETQTKRPKLTLEISNSDSEVSLGRDSVYWAAKW